ncbi:MAG TPA: poly granule associated family protein [Ottowia sp.]|uniref:poly granule associated family protein n=1 Tax=Ottowia sp. TaxID=1898956 RepID=UPI002BDF437D|nr:poly granule associated family protein [Ottowia sp.]HMN21561.1 poly granule associated family protein [Ottowia sp.]
MARKPPSPAQPARKRAAARKAAPAAASRAKTARGGADVQASARRPEDLLHAGLKAFRLENLLGLVPPPASPPQAGMPGLGFGALDSFGFRKFEDVFDQRVASALRHLGWPEPEAVLALLDEVQQLRSELEALRRAQRKSAPAKSTSRSGGRSGR